MDYRTFVTNLSNLERYKKERRVLEEKIDLILYTMTGVKGINYSKVPTSYNPSLSESQRLELIERYNEKLKEHKFIVLAIDNIESTLKKMPQDLQLMLIDVFIYKKTYKAVGIKYGYSDAGLWAMLKRETEKYL